jgi:hypothetical protein
MSTPTEAVAAQKIADLLAALRGIQQMSLQAKKGPAHVAKLTLGMMADVAAEAIAKAEAA